MPIYLDDSLKARGERILQALPYRIITVIGDHGGDLSVGTFKEIVSSAKRSQNVKE